MRKTEYSHLASLDDKALCDLFKKGSPVSVDVAGQAKAVLYHRWVSPVEGYIKGFGICQLDAEGLAATALMNCINAISNGGLKVPFKNYVFCAAKNDAVRFNQKKAKFDLGQDFHSGATGSWDENLVDETQDVFQSLLYKQRLAAVTTAMEALPMEERAVLVLETYEHMTLKEIAEYMGVPYTTVRKRKERAIKKIQQHPAVQKMAAKK